ncbi:hypothetical protein [Methanooceanicella nereidis]|nr:hypothetical protein [Methanocella sp. CWC-04]
MDILSILGTERARKVLGESLVPIAVIVLLGLWSFIVILSTGFQ